MKAYCICDVEPNANCPVHPGRSLAQAVNVDALMTNLKNVVFILDHCREKVVDSNPKLFTSPADHKFIEVHNLCVDVCVALNKLNQAKAKSFAALKYAEHLDKQLKKSRKKHEAGCDCTDCRAWTS